MTARLMALALLTLTGCQLLVTSELETIHCSLEGAEGAPYCPDGSVCKSGVCDPIGVGLATCDRDADCDAGLGCFPMAAFGSARSVCTRGCCGSATCPTGTVCAVPESGAAGLCVETRMVGASPPGPGIVGEPCDDGRDCRSGRCHMQQCADVCCGDADCAASGSVCAWLPDVVASEPAFVCSPSVQGKASGEACAKAEECESRWCGDDGYCARPCCGSVECLAAGAGTCSPVNRGSKRSLVCEPGGETGELALGAACLEDRECASGRCLREGNSGRCSDVCCVDADCGAQAVCRPTTSDPELLMCAHVSSP